jgi:hypothetical protein
MRPNGDLALYGSHRTARPNDEVPTPGDRTERHLGPASYPAIGDTRPGDTERVGDAASTHRTRERTAPWRYPWSEPG